MIPAVLALFGAGFAVALFVVVAGRRRRRGYPVLAGVHALLMVSAVSVLAARVFSGPRSLPYNSALFLFVIALIGGALIPVLKKPGEPPLLPLVFIHGAMAVAAVTVLILGFAR